MILFLVGLFVGANLGLLVAGLCVAAKRGDERYGRQAVQGEWVRRRNPCRRR